MMPFCCYIQRECIVRFRSAGYWLITILLPVMTVLIGSIETDYGGGENDMTSLIVFSALMFLFIFFYGVQAMRGIATLRKQRVVELLLVRLKPWQIVVGQIVAIGIVALVQVTLWEAFAVMVGGSVLFSLSGLLWLLGGYVLYAALFAIAGVYVSEENSTQALTLLITIVAVLSHNAVLFALSDTQSSLARFCAYFPMTSPLLLGFRGIEFPVWQRLLSAAILMLTAAMTISIGCRYFKRKCL